MRCYFEVTELETNMTVYRKKLHTKFTEMHPEFANISEQRLSHQRRSIVNNRLVCTKKLEDIKKEVLNYNPHVQRSQSANTNTSENMAHSVSMQRHNFNKGAHTPPILMNTESLHTLENPCTPSHTDTGTLPIDISNTENDLLLNNIL